MKTSTFIIAAICFSPISSFAQDCQNATQVEKAGCLTGKLEKIDRKIEAKLNENIKNWQSNAKEGIPGGAENVAAIKQSQISWLKYRADACEAVNSSYWGGSGGGLAVKICEVQLSKERLEFLSAEH